MHFKLAAMDTNTEQTASHAVTVMPIKHQWFHLQHVSFTAKNDTVTIKSSTQRVALQNVDIQI